MVEWESYISLELNCECLHDIRAWCPADIARGTVILLCL
jgi:hypothetical protein